MCNYFILVKLFFLIPLLLSCKKPPIREIDKKVIIAQNKHDIGPKLVKTKVKITVDSSTHETSVLRTLEKNGVSFLNQSIKLVYVASGEFKMGENVISHLKSKKYRNVKISRPYLIGKFEITQKQYISIKKQHSFSWENDELPVVKVKWKDANDFCKRLTAIEKKAGRIPVNYVYRLPTEAEWEFAAKGGLRAKPGKFCGWNSIKDAGWSADNSHGPKKGGKKKPNPLGIFDMCGNVEELCLDTDYKYINGNFIDPLFLHSKSVKSNMKDKITRGGSYFNNGFLCTSIRRGAIQDDYTTDLTGFRIVLAPKISLLQKTIIKKSPSQEEE
jgi:formylglycine-generating enzyme required for sulfatase activity